MYMTLAAVALVALAPLTAPGAVTETPGPAPSSSGSCPAPRPTTATPVEIGSTEVVFFVENDRWIITCPPGTIAVRVFSSAASAEAWDSPVASAYGPADGTQGNLRVTGLLPDTDYWYRADYRGGVTRSAVLGPVRTAAPAGTGCVATFQTLSSWTDGFVAQVEVHNTGTSELHGWQVRWSWNSGEQVTVMWNASPSLSGTVQIATSLSYNSTLAPGTSTLFGFLGAGAGSRPSTVECASA